MSGADCGSSAVIHAIPSTAGCSRSGAVGMAPEEDAHDPPRGGDLGLPQLIGDGCVVAAKVLEAGAGEFIAPSKFYETVHREPVFPLNVLKDHQATLLVLNE